MNTDNQKVTATLPMNIVEAASVCVSFKDARPLVNCIQFFDGVCMATDGHMLVYLSGLDFKGKFSMTYDMAKWLLKAKKEFDDFSITVQKGVEEDEIVVTLRDGRSRTELTFDAATRAQETAAHYAPDREIGTPAATVLATSNIERIGRIGKILKRPVAYTHTLGRNANVIRLCETTKAETTDVHIVVMPLEAHEFYQKTAQTH